MLPDRAARLPRTLHPGAWWVWAIGLATVASRTTNPIVLLLVLAVAGFVVGERRGAAPWSRSYAAFLKMGLVVVAIRLVFQVVLGVAQGTTLLFTLPSLALPEWAAGVTLGGPVTLESVVAAGSDGLRLATILACVGAANALANPKRLLAAMPAALYEVGVAVVVALSFAPALVGSVQRVRAARRLRGRPDRGLRSILTVALPVVEDALDRSLSLAAAMDSRGYGRRADVSAGVRRATATLTLGGLLGACIGLYGVLDAQVPTGPGAATLVVGMLLAVAGMALGGRRGVRSRYRPDPWASPEWWTAATGVVAAAAVIVAGVTDPVGITPRIVPLSAPGLPAVAVVGLLVALLPAWVTPTPRDRTVAVPAADAVAPTLVVTEVDR